MSTEMIKEIVCPQCGEPQRYRILAGIDARQNPELKSRILDETLFDWRCSRCNYFANMVYPLIYTDPARRLAVSLEPAGTDSHASPTQAVRGYSRRAVKNLAELKEKILIFDAGYDDVAMELVKDALCDNLRKTLNLNRIHAYFSRKNQQTGNLEFAVFAQNQPLPAYQSTKADIYNQSAEILRAINYRDPEGFSVVDARLARDLIDEYSE